MRVFVALSLLTLGACSARRVTEPTQHDASRATRKDYMTGPSGSKLLVEVNHDLPLVRVTAALRTGGAEDSAEQDGLASFTTDLMARGAAGRSREAIDATVDGLGATLAITTDYDGVHFEITVLRDRLDAAMALLSDVLLRPDFLPDEGAKLRRELLSQLDELREEDSQLARRFLAKQLFGKHPYGRTLTGTAQTIAGLNEKSARAWHERAVRGPGVIFGFAGDIEPETAEVMVNQHFAKLPPGDPADYGRLYPDPEVRKGTRLTIVDKPERTQSQILFGHIAPNWRDPDFNALQVAVHAFGGTFTSRLMQEIRAKRGLSYGTSARIGQGRGPRAFVMNVFPSLDQSAETFGLMRSLFETFSSKGITPAEVEFARANLRESFSSQLATPEDRLDMRLTAELAGLPADYVDRFGERVTAVKHERANAAIARALRPADLEIVVVATAAELQPKLKAAGLLEGITVEVVPYDKY